MPAVRLILALAASILFLTARPAAADDGRRHVMTALQKIDLVRDLPDEPAFERDGQYFDLGYIYPVHIVNGASVASTGGSGESGYVLYHDDRYIRADSGIMADLEMVLGDDPTQGYTPPVPVSAGRSATNPWGADDKSGDAPSPGAGGRPFKYQPPARSGGSPFGWFTPFLGFGIIAGLRFGIPAFLRVIIGGGLAKAVIHRAAEPSVGGDPFEARVAARLAQLQGGQAPAQPATLAGFGRKPV